MKQFFNTKSPINNLTFKSFFYKYYVFVLVNMEFFHKNHKFNISYL